MYTIGQVSELFGLPISTLRYYDKEGLLPGLERQSGQRRFSDQDLERLRVIECLKVSGLAIKEIKQFIRLCDEGPSTYEQRLQLFEARRAATKQEMARLQQTLDMLDFKCWYYETAIEDGNEDQLNAMIPDSLPPEIQRLYDSGHGLGEKG